MEQQFRYLARCAKELIDGGIQVTSCNGRVIFKVVDFGRGIYNAKLYKDNQLIYSRSYGILDIKDYDFKEVQPCGDEVLNLAHMMSDINLRMFKGVHESDISFYQVADEINKLIVSKINDWHSQSALK